MMRANRCVSLAATECQVTWSGVMPGTVCTREISFRALMLSVITRNTAVSVGVSVGIYFIGSLVSQVLMVFSMMNQ